MSTKPLRIAISAELWNEEAISRLIQQGHTIFQYPTMEPTDVIIGRSAWRIPGSIPLDEVYTHIDMIIKQIRILLYADTPPPKPSSRGTATKPKKATARKPRALPATTLSGVPVQGGTTGEGRPAGDNQLTLFGTGGLDYTPVKPVRKQKGITDGNRGSQKDSEA